MVAGVQKRRSEGQARTLHHVEIRSEPTIRVIVVIGVDDAPLDAVRIELITEPLLAP